MTGITDPKFGLDRYAWTLLALLSTFEPDFARFNEQAQMYDVRLQTDVRRDGDRNWVALTMWPALDAKEDRKVVAFGRDPYKDEIVVESWDWADATADDVASTIHRFSPQELLEAALHVKRELAVAYDLYRGVQA